MCDFNTVFEIDTQFINRLMGQFEIHVLKYTLAVLVSNQALIK